ncbi:MAG: PIN domain-containing protein [Actinomycetota bacterium]|nr:PIN domain-containing protein [Actinomycetota bacterium]
MSPEVLVLDASVGVKWLRREPGSDEARELLAQHAEGVVCVVVPVIFVHEVLDVTRRLYGVARACGLWERLEHDEITVVGLDSRLVRETLDMAEVLGCTFYDAAAPALATRVGAVLVSADRRAHGAVERVRLLGR